MVRNLAYAGFTSPQADEWRTFGPDILGAELAPDGPDGEVRLRLDDRAWRISVRPGETDDVAHLGWAIDGDAREALIGRLADADIEVMVDDDLAAERRVGSLAWFVDPFGFRHELIDAIDQGPTFTAGRPLDGSFVTGEQGVGHVVLIVPDLEAGHRFYAEVLGLVISDHIQNGRLDLAFYHCPGESSRHHTVALSAAPGLVGMHHLMVEVTDVDDVGRALDLAKSADLSISMDLGRHPNDLMTSFYVRTPSGFDLEYGSGGVVVDDRSWEPTSYDAASIWGHRPPEGGAAPPGIIRRVA